jgi:hypothetical protein
MTKITENLTRYLEIEGLLNTFFDAVGYCLEKCVKQALALNGNQPFSACCKNRYHCLYDLPDSDFDRLRSERENRFGKPEEQPYKSPVSPCEYHGPFGCVLATHKSPICLAFMCRESIDYIRETYGIYEYDYLGMNYALEWILTGVFTDGQYREFRESLENMIRRVVEKNEHSPAHIP